MTLEDPTSFLHLTSGTSPSEHVELALKKLGRTERVLRTVDGLSIGPLAQVDEGPAERIAFWSRLEGTALSDEVAAGLDDRAVWEAVRGSELPVVVWHGPLPTERLLAMRVCWHLRDQPERLHEVKLPPGSNPHLPPFYGAVGIVGPDALVGAWPTLRPVADPAGQAAAWVALRSHEGDWIRDLDGDEIVELPVDSFDALLIAMCVADWRASNMVVASVLAEVPTGDAFLRWRVRELLAAGALEGRGGPLWLGLPKELRAKV